jgi:hypothetical protein
MLRCLGRHQLQIRWRTSELRHFLEVSRLFHLGCVLIRGANAKSAAIVFRRDLSAIMETHYAGSESERVTGRRKRPPTKRTSHCRAVRPWAARRPRQVIARGD